MTPTIRVFLVSGLALLVASGCSTNFKPGDTEEDGDAIVPEDSVEETPGDVVEESPSDPVVEDVVTGCTEDDDCNDGVSCTVDECNTTDGTCSHTADDDLCDDGAFCNGEETCDETDDCQDGTAPAVDDGVDCTIDACSEDADAVTHTPSHDLCDDGQFCNGTETCDATDDCQEGTAPTVDDGIGCTVDACDETTRTVTHTPDHSVCAGMHDCLPAETCTTTSGCTVVGRAYANCRVVDGKSIFVVPMSTGENGNTVCSAVGLTCTEAPVFTTPSAACVAFHPGATVTSDYNGWRQGVYCNYNSGAACSSRVGCHDCPACGPYLDCSIASSTQLEELYVECVP